jgi:hypothetical protein
VKPISGIAVLMFMVVDSTAESIDAAGLAIANVWFASAVREGSKNEKSGLRTVLDRESTKHPRDGRRFVL